MIIYLARHGETTGDIENRYGGDYDDHLTELGQNQSKELANKLVGKGIQKIFASPLIRAQETAAFLTAQLGLAAETLPAFKERNGYGILTGLPKSEALQKYPEQVALLKDVHESVKGAENYSLFQQRIISSLDDLKDEPYERVAVITHGGPLKLIYRDILKIGEIDVADCALVALEADASGYKIIEQEGITLR